ncbi:hypothetical protein [Haloarcula pellucida]|uniref:Restriction endonuclease n=1 Tax=Haloarcula pellucida TaxID=1427151 RepID=A0A830GJB2_9EURY|nr:hypothetical protein [Halomicroarcula pellucida]MBX0348561.1 hypothetical protein [Halomicroarcula pellucida]GGN92833.1 hypothetical protein GCM10009030_17470 [Halomicroarcula pellucida]
MTYERTEEEDAAIVDFLADYFPERYDGGGQQSLFADEGPSVEDFSDTELEEIETLVDSTESAFNSSKGILGLALDFLMVAEELSRADDRLEGFQPEIDRAQLFTWYDNGAKTSLTLVHDSRYSIRSVHNDVIELFRSDLLRTNFPSSPGHHTGEWERYDDLLESSFRLSSAGRHEAAQRLFDIGLDQLAARDFDTRDPPFPDPFKEILNDYPRKHPDEEGGLTYQALSYGYIRTNWPHLSFRASKVRTGSSRQHRYGDIDGYHGPDLMLSVEVKDKPIDESNVHAEFEAMMDLAERTNVVVVGICRSVTAEAEEILSASGVEILTDTKLEEELKFWDYHKQDRAVQGMLHFLSSIEEDPAAVQRLLQFVKDVDPENRAIVHLNTDKRH